MTGTSHDYVFEDKTYEGYLTQPGQSPKGLVIVGHAWAGLGDYEREICDRFAADGFAVFGYDLYGKGQRGTTVEENQALMGPLVGDRGQLQARLAASIDEAQKATGIASEKTVVVGYCFGGLCALDAARARLNVAGVVSMHGLFFPAGNLPAETSISAKILLQHGYNDPMANPEAMVGVMNELTKAGADWRLTAHGGVMHAFTNKDANDPQMGTVYNAAADHRSWSDVNSFLLEVMS